MHTSMIKGGLAVALVTIVTVATLAGQQAPASAPAQPRPFNVAKNVGPNAYDVAPDWALPYPKAGYTWGSVPGSP